VSSDASRHRLAILVFSPYLAPHVGGVESFVSELSEVMLRGTEVDRITVFTSHLPPTTPLRVAATARRTAGSMTSTTGMPGYRSRAR